jgi:antitoxin YefM
MNLINNEFSRQETSPSAARQDFFQMLDSRNERLRQRIAKEREIYIINRPDGENIALIPESDLNSLIETVYLFRSPTNARRLLDALDEAKSGKIVPQSIEELQQELGVSGKKEEEEK